MLRRAAAGSELPWSKEAAQLLQCAPAASRFDLRRCVTQHAQSVRATSITPELFFQAKPPPTKLYPSAMAFQFARHVGPVHDASCSPFHRNLFLTCAADGEARVYSMLQVPAPLAPLPHYACRSICRITLMLRVQSRPVLALEPGSGFLYAAAWSYSRPAVFGIAGEDGVVHVVDLLVRRAPSAERRAPGAGRRAPCRLRLLMLAARRVAAPRLLPRCA